MRKLLFTSALFLIAFQTAFCQTDSSVIKNAVSKIQTLINTHIIEKAYLHFDKPYYAAGDTIYFKAYVTLGERHELSKMSGILHVDLIDKNDALMQSLVLQLNNGLAVGDFSLSDTLQKGSYRIRAYTNWMRNNGPEYFFNKYVSVGSINSIEQPVAVKAQQPAIQFFPEGGQMVVDVPSKVAFKALASNGLGINVKGVIVDNNNKEVAKLESAHLGMGTFDLIPEAGLTYRARLTFANGQQATVNLPDAQAKGIVLALNNNKPDKIFIEIRANRDYYKENLNKDINLIIYSGGSVNTIKTKLDNEILGLTLPKASFRSGILQVTLLSQTGEPLSERLAFIQNQDFLNLSVNTDKPLYKTNQKVHLNINAKTRDNIATAGYFSVAVVDENKVPADDMDNTILSNLLLTSELKGYVEQPNYYFATVTPETQTNLDALMLTQGYRRFVWKDLLNNNTTATNYQPEGAFSIAGVIKSKAGVPLANKNVQLLSANGGGGILTQVTDVNGNFKFQQLSYYDNSKFILKTESGSGKNQAIITINNNDNTIAPLITPRDMGNVHYNEKADVMASIAMPQRQGMPTANNTTYKSAIVADEKPTINRDNYRSSNLSGPGHADQVILSDQIVGSTTLSVALTGVARGVDFYQGAAYLKGNQKVSGSGIQTEPMLLIIDGTPSQSIDDIDPNFVEAIEILKGTNATIYGIRGAAGVLVVTTKQAGSRTISTEMAPGILSIIPKGFYKAREFYSPQYDNPNFQKPGADNRTTIFWNPNVITDKNGNAAFDFFNADGKGTYRVVVEGIDDNGNLGRQVFKYKVE